LGTTDTPLEKHSIEPVALDEEVEFILNTVKRYMTRPPKEEDVLSVFAGLRPLAAPSKNTNSTKEISRDHKLIVSDTGLITITGGKWTTYRKMAEETVNKAIEVGKLSSVDCSTKEIAIHGCTTTAVKGYLSVYGTDAEKIQHLIREQPVLAEQLTDEFPYTAAEVVWAARNEMARTIEDVLARRMRMLFLNAKAALKAAPRVASLLASELNYDQSWEQSQLKEFNDLANQYLLKAKKVVAPHIGLSTLRDEVIN
jgi:glycerol-3-phosphate dehydrogenase